MVKYPYRTQPPEYQADATLSQDNPVSGTKYVVLDTVKNVRIISIMIKVAWTGQPSPLQVWVTIDGQLLEFTKANPETDVGYTTVANPLGVGWELLKYDGYYGRSRAFFLEGRSVKVEVETTGGTVSNLSARVKYAKY